MDRKLSILSKVSLFKNFDENSLLELKNLIKTVRYKSNKVILNTHDIGDALYIISKGKVKVTLNSENGKEIILSIMKAGEIFGEISLIDG